MIKISLPTALAVLFITLKLCDIIHWSWISVLSPIWVSVFIWLVFITFIVLKKIKEESYEEIRKIIGMNKYSWDNLSNKKKKEYIKKFLKPKDK